jgi:hypothetical protein
MERMKDKQNTISTTLTVQTARPESYATISPEEKKPKKDTEMEESANFRQEIL